MTAQNSRDTSPIQRVLTFVVLVCILVSFVAISAILAGYATGTAAHDGFSHGLWPAVLVTPMIGFPLGFIVMMVLLVISTTGKNRRTRKGAR